MYNVFVSGTSKYSLMILKCLIWLSEFLYIRYICIYAKIKCFVQQSLLFSFIVYRRVFVSAWVHLSLLVQSCFMIHVQCNTDVTVRLVWILVPDSSVGRAPDYRFRGLGFKSLPCASLFPPFRYTWCPANSWNWQANSGLGMLIYKCKDHSWEEECDCQTGSNTSAR